MACKRAQIAAVLTATAASDIFTQDVEDMDGQVLDPGSIYREPLKEPQAETTQGNAKQEEKVIDVGEDVPFSPSDSAKIKPDQHKEEIGVMLTYLAGEGGNCGELLKKYTSYTRRDKTVFEGHATMDKISPAALKVTHDRIRKDWIAKYGK